MVPFIDLSGKVFEYLTVLERYPENTKAGKAQWRVQCRCGITKIIVGASLISGLVKSCGCRSREHAKYINSWVKPEHRMPKLIGFRFGKLVVLEIAKNMATHHKAKWRCLCDCGSITYVTTYHLRSKQTKSCGCGQWDGTTKHGLSKTIEYRRAFDQRRREQEHKLDCQWTPLMEKCLSVFQPECVICGSVEDLATDHVYPLSRGFGLYPGNVVKLCKSCNSTKSNKMPDNLPKEFRDRLLSESESFRLAWSGGF